MPKKIPPRRKTDVSHITVCDAVQKRLLARYDQLGTWKAVGDEIGVAAGTVNRVATTDYRPRNSAIRVKLGLTALIPTPACAICGKVHTTTRCHTTRKASKPRVGPTRRQMRWLQVAGMLWGGEGPRRPRPASIKQGR